MIEKAITKEVERQEKIETIKLVIEALGKQIPKKPTLQLLDSGSRINVCPVCANAIFPNQKYCDECGQKMKWG